MFKKLQTNIDFSKVNPPSKEKIDGLLQLKVDEALKSIDLTQNLNNRIWFSDFDNKGLKNVVRFQLTKGLGAVFVFGKCFTFLPTISSSKKLINHKTDKSTTVHLFDHSDSLMVRNIFRQQKPLRLSIINHSTFSKDLDNFVQHGIEQIKNWFDINQSIEDCINTALNQLSAGEQYSLHSPNQNYILSFLYSEIGKEEEAKKHLNKFIERRYNMLNKEIESKIREKIKTLANKV